MTAAHNWVAGEKPDAEFRVEVDQARTAFERSRDRVGKLKTPTEFKAAHALYEASAELYVSMAQTYDAALGVPAGDGRTQLDLLARRLRELGDRVFDRGRVALGLQPQATPNIEVHVPEEVPIWTAEGLAAGPPLDDPPPAPATSPPLREESRPQQSRAGWNRDVQDAGAPSAADLRGTIAGSDDVKLQGVARFFASAAEQLRHKPDPRNGREESARLRLAWLVSSEAARAAQAGIVFGRDGLTGVARQLEQTAAMISS